MGNILKKAEGGRPGGRHVNPALLQRRPRRRFAACSALCPEANAQFDAGDYTASLQTLAVLRARWMRSLTT